MTDDREQLKDQFLDSIGWNDAIREHLSGDASFRSYERVRMLTPATTSESLPESVEPFSTELLEFAVLMDAPPPEEDIKPFISIAKMLQKRGLNAPLIYGADEDNGLILLQDFGDNRYNRILNDNATIVGDENAKKIYTYAIDVLLQLHGHAIDDALPAYNDALYKKELTLLTSWYMPLMGTETTTTIEGEFLSLWTNILKQIDTLPSTIVLRDYHADNLMWLDDKQGISQVGLLDFQDAVLGSPAYDMVSLLEDARRDVSIEFAEEMITYYLANAARIDENNFRTSYAILGAQRNIKILGIFARLCERDDKSDYLDFIPRVWKYLEHDLSHPALKPIKRFMDTHFPKEQRINIPQHKKKNV
jgi:aminoglycoside/choline kinase family phosphotransferase